jgi:eukaryotic-like serine/threonine-protein kinase
MGIVAEPDRFGAYIVHERLGQGGMAEVHRAERVNKDGTRTPVALKRLLAKTASNRELRQWFTREGALMRHLHHPNIAETFDNGSVKGIGFIAMEYVVGPTLRQLVEHTSRTIGTLPIPITLTIASQVCDALEHAHLCRDDKGQLLHLVHRDVCPANILLREDGVIKVIDFGLAKVKGVDEDTGKGKLKGKFNYVAPEYIAGEAFDGRADLWALGVVMYELLTSRRLFDAPDTHQTITRVQKLPIPRPSRANPQVSPELDEIVMTALERDPRRRWQSARLLSDALRGRMVRRGDPAEAKHVAEWVQWLYAQQPGTQASGLSQLRAIVAPPTPPGQRDTQTTKSRLTRLTRRLFGSRDEH